MLQIHTYPSFENHLAWLSIKDTLNVKLVLIVQNYCPLVHHSIPIQQMDQMYNTMVFQSLLYPPDSDNNFYQVQMRDIFQVFYYDDEDIEMTMADKLSHLNGFSMDVGF